MSHADDEMGWDHISGREGERDGEHEDHPVTGARQQAVITRLSSRVVYRNDWMTVREDEVRFPGGHEGIYGVVDKPDFALVVPWDGHKLHMVRQYRYPIGGAFWEFPQGSADDREHTPEELARRELREETGLSAGDMTRLGFLYQANGYSNQGFHVFLATGLTAGKRRLEATEAGMETAAFDIDELERLMLAGEIRDGPTVSAYGLLRLRGSLI